LRVLVGADGNLQQLSVVRGLPDGLTQQAIAAAREAKFKPAMKDGTGPILGGAVNGLHPSVSRCAQLANAIMCCFGEFE